MPSSSCPQGHLPAARPRRTAAPPGQQCSGAAPPGPSPPAHQPALPACLQHDTSVRMAPSCSGHACRSCKTQCMAAWLAGGRHVAPHALTPPFTHAADASSITHCLLPSIAVAYGIGAAALEIATYLPVPSCLAQSLCGESASQACLPGGSAALHCWSCAACAPAPAQWLRVDVPLTPGEASCKPCSDALHCCHGSASNIATATASHHEYAQSELMMP